MLDELPDDLKLAHSRTIIIDAYVAYNSELSALSNFYTCDIPYEGKVF